MYSQIPSKWSGVMAATLCAFHRDQEIDFDGLHDYFVAIASTPGITALVCNGHTGEIMSLRPAERAAVTAACRRAVNQVNTRHDRVVQVVSGVSAEGSFEAIDHALAAKDAGVDAILLMPPHHWLRFGRSHQTAVGFIADVAHGAGIPIIVHQYPSWTKAGYSLAEMKEMVHIPEVVCIKMGTRDMARWGYDYEELKAENPDVSIVTCHDEFLLPTLAEAGDGALIGFAGFAPGLMVKVVHALLAGDLAAAKAAQKLVAPLARIIYRFGEPGCEAHQRMKAALWLLGKFPSATMRRPLSELSVDALCRIQSELRRIGLESPVQLLNPPCVPSVSPQVAGHKRSKERAEFAV